MCRKRYQADSTTRPAPEPAHPAVFPLSGRKGVFFPVEPGGSACLSLLQRIFWGHFCMEERPRRSRVGPHLLRVASRHSRACSVTRGPLHGKAQSVKLRCVPQLFFSPLFRLFRILHHPGRLCWSARLPMPGFFRSLPSRLPVLCADVEPSLTPVTSPKH